MERNIFRKNAVDRINSPEQLNEYIKVVGPGVWSMLGGLMILFAAFIIWGFMGSLPQTVTLTGTALAAGGEPLSIYCYAPIDDAIKLAEGMEVRVSPNYAPREQFGYIYGKIKSVGQAPVSVEKLKSALGGDFALLSIPAGNVIEVIVELEAQDGALQWSAAKGASVDVAVGSTCTLDVVTSERKPYELLFR